ncbi:AGAP004124-PA-like protein [Anopheles sinensis]|uniref:AGAP004124-PA-like protein n=1 Tax=Anopheles sinensis TaxID=74873 RepID=A0A084VL75_ANOSI|nr:AGAP004124-PA-like protein [Anopheles sinensis]
MFNIRGLSRPIALGVILILTTGVLTGTTGEKRIGDVSNHTESRSRNDLDEFEDALTDYVSDWFSRNSEDLIGEALIRRRGRQEGAGPNGTTLSEFDRFVVKGVARLLGTAADAVSSRSLKASESGRLFFFKGMKKLLWPVMIGLQIVKTVLIMMFLPSIIGSFGKILGKGLSSVSGLSHPVQTVDDLDFKDTTSYNADHDFGMNDGHGYLPPDDNHASGTSYNGILYDPPVMGGHNANAGNALSRLGYGGGRVTYVGPGMEAAKRKQQSAKNDFKIFHDIPSSSLLLTNYDPFYSPLLSRLDAIFAQMGVSNREEQCRQRLVCLMYANPAKYAPYSNLISAQLSRELDELRKPTNDNPDILRFFKYMRAAKDGQDGVDCDAHYKDCTGYKDLSNPAMVTTFNDINKLVHARKL